MSSLRVVPEEETPGGLPIAGPVVSEQQRSEKPPRAQDMLRPLGTDEGCEKFAWYAGVPGRSPRRTAPCGPTQHGPNEGNQIGLGDDPRWRSRSC
ncbi:hypothetical protein NDU88_001321 [Pleurodeles waltl]|uniref:Uncharacterized protein n=1 Tax=Pleurodeles waltl TaxID=8319 RepID=A0AAV7UVQ2_PLEWA|nr:hypothetical protein NDU88_001321 [Pleurodeles waltl]